MIKLEENCNSAPWVPPESNILSIYCFDTISVTEVLYILVQEVFEGGSRMISLVDFKIALGTLVDELSEEEILKLRSDQDQMAELFFDLWLENTNGFNKINV